MKILCVIDSLGSGGAQKQIVELSKGFKSRGHDVRFVVYHDINFYKDDLEYAGIEVFSILEKNYFKRLIKIRSFIRRNNFDAVLSFLQAANFICEMSALPTKKWKLIVGERSANPNILRSLKLKFFRWCHFFADHVVSNSHENMKLIKRINPLLSEKKCHVIYNVINFDIWKPQPTEFVNKNETYKLIVIASHRYLKNARGLIEAVSLLTYDERANLSIDWYGGGRNDNSFNDAVELIKVNNLDSIFTFHNPINNVAEKVKLADAVGLFSFYEGLPNTVCEGMAMGKVVISSNISDVPLILDHCNNLLFNPKKVNEIVEVLRRVMSLKKVDISSIGSQNTMKARELFDKEKIVTEYLKLMMK